ncbi:hypothetical protein A2U01_0040554, partial [Trifolium medium]|nr:hypothetical protein [Trifolium medium]
TSSNVEETIHIRKGTTTTSKDTCKVGWCGSARTSRGSALLTTTQPQLGFGVERPWDFAPPEIDATS